MGRLRVSRAQRTPIRPSTTSQPLVVCEGKHRYTSADAGKLAMTCSTPPSHPISPLFYLPPFGQSKHHDMSEVPYNTRIDTWRAGPLHNTLSAPKHAWEGAAIASLLCSAPPLRPTLSRWRISLECSRREPCSSSRSLWLSSAAFSPQHSSMAAISFPT